MCGENQGILKELLLLQNDDLRSMNKELFDLSLEVGSLYNKNHVHDNSIEPQQS